MGPQRQDVEQEAGAERDAESGNGPRVLGPLQKLPHVSL